MQAGTGLKAPCQRFACKQVAATRFVSRRILVCRANSTAAHNDSRVASVRVDMGSGVHKMDVALTDPNTRLVKAKMDFPLGLVLEDVEDKVVVTEVSRGSAAAAANCQVGDVLRATTAMTMQMTYPTMNIMFGGVGKPKLSKVLLATDKVPFHKVMDAVRSNSTAQGGDGSIVLVLERVEDVPAAADAASAAKSGRIKGLKGIPTGAAAGTAFASENTGAVFDPKIFE